eukprot:jgi/Chlat1/2167/Chrsp17S02734
MADIAYKLRALILEAGVVVGVGMAGKVAAAAAGVVEKPALALVRTAGLPILRQLRLEEALLRADDGNWAVINDGNAAVDIVMGISGKPEELLHVEEVRAAGIPVIKRFSGGGTVVVDEGTVFVSLIGAASALPSGVECFPRPLMRWTEAVYAPAFTNCPGFLLKEHDYAIGERKFGGNAQSIAKQRWVHHTSMLWDYRDDRMALLKQPNRAPAYRAGRRHEEFLCKLMHYFPSRPVFLDAIEQALRQHFSVHAASLADAQAVLSKKHLHSTTLVDLDQHTHTQHQ